MVHKIHKINTIIFFSLMIAAVSTMTKRAIGAITGNAETPWWTGVPTKLIRKQTLVEGTPTTEAFEAGSTLTLPVKTLTFAIPDVLDEEDDDTNSEENSSKPRLTGRARRHDRLRMEYGDVAKMVIPGYKPKSYSVSGLRPDLGEFDITIKVYPNGRASGFLDRLGVGETIHSFGICKNKSRNIPKEDATNNSNKPFVVGLIAYGVGITEAWPIAKAELDRDIDKAHKVVLVWASRTPGDTFWNDQLADYQARHPDRFELVRIYSRAQVDGCLQGRIDEGVLADIFGNGNNNNTRFLSVGTKAMMRKTDEMLRSIGYAIPEHNLLV